MIVNYASVWSIEPTQLEYLSDASFLGKLLAFPANVRLDWKVNASYKHSSLFGLIDSDKGKKFYNIDTRCGVCWLSLIT
jgi:hypothetical protein